MAAQSLILDLVLLVELVIDERDLDSETWACEYHSAGRQRMVGSLKLFRIVLSQKKKGHDERDDISWCGIPSTLVRHPSNHRHRNLQPMQIRMHFMDSSSSD